MMIVENFFMPKIRLNQRKKIKEIKKLTEKLETFYR